MSRLGAVFLLIKTAGVYRYIYTTCWSFEYSRLASSPSTFYMLYTVTTFVIKDQRNTKISKGQCLEICNFRLFMTHLFPRPPDYSISAISKNSKSRGYLQLKVHCKKILQDWTLNTTRAKA